MVEPVQQTLEPRTSAAGYALDSETARAARAFMLRIADRYSMTEALVYGSRARGDHKPDSDVDIAIVLKGDSGDRWEVTRELSGIAFDVILATGILIQPLPFGKANWSILNRSANLRRLKISGARGFGCDQPKHRRQLLAEGVTGFG